MTDQTEDGTLDQLGNRWRVVFTRTLAHAPEKVWRALTEPEHLRAWFPTEIVGERTAGARLRFEFRDGQYPGFDGRMLTCDPPRVLEFEWGEDRLRFELTPTRSGTVLTLTDTLGELGKAARDGAGWHECLDKLAYALDGTEPPWVKNDRWREVHPGYVERFGPDASSVGPPDGHPAGD
ncbi:MAG: SRPBCC family protein [Acidimicrobiia bacterium]